MNILIIPAFFQTKKNPTFGSFFTDQARALCKNGHHVNILYCDTYSVKCIRDYAEYDEEAVSELEGIRIYRKRLFCTLKHGIEGYRERFAEGIMQLYDQYLIDDKPDVIHAHCCVWAGYAAMKLSDKIQVPYIVTEHATLFQLHRDRIRHKNDLYIKETFIKAARLICVSRAFANLLSEYRSDIDIVGNVVDCDQFRIVDKKRQDTNTRFLTVCYMENEAMLRKKGIDILLKSWKDLSIQMPKVHLTIGGGGQGTQKAVEWCKEYGIEQSVAFTGQLSRQQVVAQMQVCDVFVLPSRYETFGVVYIEAMACGKPVIAVANGGPDDFVTEENGILIPPDDTDKLKQAFEFMVKHHGDYNAEMIRKFVEQKFGAQAIAAQLEHIYADVRGKG
ncbi:MAG: glycosyltransferase [Lachnospiraceae bacterium]|nr:glycosyltransferase [Lachnospiraceae bacterium]